MTPLSPMDEQRILNREERMAWRRFTRQCYNLHLVRTMDAGRSGWRWLYGVNRYGKYRLTGTLAIHDEGRGTVRCG